jgi:hypothetical protein
MSTDGWDDPDSGDYCFIVFQYASRGLCEYDPIGWANYGEFVSWFYYYALYYHFSINDAINAAASAILVDGGFTNCELYYGYEVEGFSCRMRIIGNGNLELPY